MAMPPLGAIAVKDARVRKQAAIPTLFTRTTIRACLRGSNAPRSHRLMSSTVAPATWWTTRTPAHQFRSVRGAVHVRWRRRLIDRDLPCRARPTGIGRSESRQPQLHRGIACLHMPKMVGAPKVPPMPGMHERKIRNALSAEIDVEHAA